MLFYYSSKILWSRFNHEHIIAASKELQSK